MKNSKNKVVAALVSGLIIGSIGTSFVGNFQSQSQTVASNSHSNNYDNSYGDDQYNRQHKRGDHGGYYEDNTTDTTNPIDTSTTTYKDGTYTGTANGYAPNLTVEVTVASGKISDIEIVSHNESPGFYESAFDQVPSSIISKQSTDVDTVSGATYSSKGIINAVEDALSDASSSQTSTEGNI